MPLHQQLWYAHAGAFPCGRTGAGRSRSSSSQTPENVAAVAAKMDDERNPPLTSREMRAQNFKKFKMLFYLILVFARRRASTRLKVEVQSACRFAKSGERGQQQTPHV